MLHKAEGFDRRKFTMAGILVAMGVVYGDIGTSPLYVMKAIVGDNGGLARVSESFILGSVSLIFWTLTILTTIKYVVIALNADNHGEGGIFSLYTLVRKKSKYLIIPAMIGGAALLADGVLTPAVTVTTAIEGLRGIPAFFERFGNDQTIIVVITLTIILILFSVQRFGTELVGKAFGPIMFLWFTFLGIIGLMNFSQDWTVIRALNPYYALQLINQVELHPKLDQKEVRDFCEKHDIKVQAWSPLMQGQLLSNETILAIAENHNKSAAQVILRWDIQQDILLAVKSVHKERMISNAAVFDFELSAEEMAQINQLNESLRVGPDPDTFDF